MHRGHRVRLGEDQQLAVARALRAASPRRTIGVARLAAACRCAGCRARCAASGTSRSCARAALEAVVAVAEEDEMPVFHPVEQRARFGDFVGRQRRRIALQLGDERAHALAHRRPVLDRDAHVGERGFESSPAALRAAPDRSAGRSRYSCQDSLRAPLRAPSPTSSSRPRAVAPHGQHRMHDEMHGDFRLAEDDADRVHAGTACRR